MIYNIKQGKQQMVLTAFELKPVNICPFYLINDLNGY